MITVRFQNVGRKRLNWSARLRVISEDALRNQVRKRLLASPIAIEFDATGLAGTIYAGLQPVGTFQVQAGQ